MVAIPVGVDQPGVAARIEWTGTGRSLLPRKLTVERLRDTIGPVLQQPSYRTAAQRLQNEIQRTNGLERTADLVEQFITLRKPRLR